LPDPRQPLGKASEAPISQVPPWYPDRRRTPARPGIPAAKKEETIDTRLIIENLSETTTESDLVALFSGVGRVRDVHFPTDRSTGEPKGFAYLAFASDSGAERAIERLDGYSLEGSAITVRWADDGRSGRGGNPGALWGSGHAGSRPKGSRRGARGRKRRL